MDNFKINNAICLIHQKPFEYFSVADSKFACLLCLKEIMFENLSSQEIVPITSKDVVLDLISMQQKLEEIKEKIDNVLKSSSIDSHEINKIFHGVIKMASYVDENSSYKNGLHVCTPK